MSNYDKNLHLFNDTNKSWLKAVCDSFGKLQINKDNLATSTLQTAGNNSLNNIDTKITKVDTDNTKLYGWCNSHLNWEKLQVDPSTHSKLLVKDDDTNNKLDSIITSLSNELNLLQKKRAAGDCYWVYNEGSTAGNLINLVNPTGNTKNFYVYNIQVGMGYNASASNSSFLAINTVVNPSTTGLPALPYYNLKLSSTTYSNSAICSSTGAFTGVRNMYKLNTRADSSYYMIDLQEELIEIPPGQAMFLYVNSPGQTVSATIRWYEETI